MILVYNPPASAQVRDQEYFGGFERAGEDVGSPGSSLPVMSEESLCSLGRSVCVSVCV